MCCYLFIIFFFKQKTAYEMRISDWSSDVCSSDLGGMIDKATFLRQQPVQERIHSHNRLHSYDGNEITNVVICRERSEERRVGKECVSTCRSRWSPDH